MKRKIDKKRKESNAHYELPPSMQRKLAALEKQMSDPRRHSVFADKLCSVIFVKLLDTPGVRGIGGSTDVLCALCNTGTHTECLFCCCFILFTD
jgi:hypothetical protein